MNVAIPITIQQANDICDVLRRRADEIASFKDNTSDVPDSVCDGLIREMYRLRNLAKALADSVKLP